MRDADGAVARLADGAGALPLHLVCANAAVMTYRLDVPAGVLSFAEEATDEQGTPTAPATDYGAGPLGSRYAHA